MKFSLASSMLLAFAVLTEAKRGKKDAECTADSIEAAKSDDGSWDRRALRACCFVKEPASWCDEGLAWDGTCDAPAEDEKASVEKMWTCCKAEDKAEWCRNKSDSDDEDGKKDKDGKGGKKGKKDKDGEDDSESSGDEKKEREKKAKKVKKARVPSETRLRKTGLKNTRELMPTGGRTAIADQLVMVKSQLGRHVKANRQSLSNANLASKR